MGRLSGAVAAAGRKAASAAMAVVLAAGLCPAAALADGGVRLAAGSAAAASAVEPLASLANQAPLGTQSIRAKAGQAKAKVKVQKKARYTGKKIHPKVIVKYKGKKLKVGRDYKVAYKNAKGKRVSAPRAAGKYKVIVKGKGAFKGKATKKFKVVGKGGSKGTASLYKAVLKKAAGGKGVFADAYGKSDKRSWESSCQYSLFDLAADGVPELIVRAGTSTADVYDYVFTVESGKAVYWGCYWCGSAGLWGTSAGELYLGGIGQGRYYQIFSVAHGGGGMEASLLEEGAESDYDSAAARIQSYLGDLGASALDVSGSVADYSLLKKALK